MRTLQQIAFVVVAASGFGVHPNEFRFWSVAKKSDRELDWHAPKVSGLASMLKRPVTTPDQVVVHSAASPDGTQLAAIGVFGFANDLTSLNVWNKDGAKSTYRRKVADRWLAQDVAWPPTMKHLATISRARVEPVHDVLAIEVWRADNPDEPTLTIETQAARGAGRFVCFSTDGQKILYPKRGALVEQKVDGDEVVEYEAGLRSDARCRANRHSCRHDFPEGSRKNQITSNKIGDLVHEDSPHHFEAPLNIGTLARSTDFLAR
ncbi:MAG: hypothetical protein CMJ78_14020 [Planctomycetaceae bacterium]|nr:hypothetical protein [Planctomycetaceae bacterium]